MASLRIGSAGGRRSIEAVRGKHLGQTIYRERGELAGTVVLQRVLHNANHVCRDGAIEAESTLLEHP